MGAVTTEGVSIQINESGGGCRDNRRYFNTNESGRGGDVVGISILINESGGGRRDNRRYFNTN